MNRFRTNPTCLDRRRARAFTLIEMLVVVAIIALLMALLTAGIGKAHRQAELKRAQAEVARLRAAFQAYQADYAVWPYVDGAVHAVDAALVRLLQGTDETSGGLRGNARRRIYMDFKEADISAGEFRDPWGTPYRVIFDSGTITDGVVTNPFGPAGYTLNRALVVWSAGPDRQNDAGGELSAQNKDNIWSY